MRRFYVGCAEARANIALIKYWGNRDHHLNLPMNGSISFNLDGLVTRTLVVFDTHLTHDRLVINGREQHREALHRAQRILAWVRERAKVYAYAHIISVTNIPLGAGLASSAAGFAALAVAASKALGLHLDERDLSRLARLGSGSAARSIPDGFVEWLVGTKDENSYAFSLFPPDYWELWDCIALVSAAHKPISSAEGHRLAETSPIQWARVTDTPRRLEICREALRRRDFAALTQIVEQDAHLLHAVMQTSTPPLFYWLPETVALMHAVRRWREEQGWNVAYTLDAGPNVHVLCTGDVVAQVQKALEAFPGVRQVLVSRVGRGARVLPTYQCVDLAKQGRIPLDWLQ